MRCAHIRVCVRVRVRAWWPVQVQLRGCASVMPAVLGVLRRKWLPDYKKGLVKLNKVDELRFKWPWPSHGGSEGSRGAGEPGGVTHGTPLSCQLSPSTPLSTFASLAPPEESSRDLCQ